MNKIRTTYIFTILIAMLLLLPLSLATSETTYTTADGLCAYDSGESRTNSPEDCSLKFEDYRLCMLDKTTCPHESVWNQIHYFLAVIILILIYLNHKNKEQKKFFTKRKRKSHTSHLPELHKRTKRKSRFKK